MWKMTCLISSLATSWALQDNLIFPLSRPPCKSSKVQNEAKKAKGRERDTGHQQAQFLRNRSTTVTLSCSSPTASTAEFFISCPRCKLYPSYNAARSQPLIKSAVPAASSSEVAGTDTASLQNFKDAKQQSDSAVQTT